MGDPFGANVGKTIVFSMYSFRSLTSGLISVVPEFV